MKTPLLILTLLSALATVACGPAQTANNKSIANRTLPTPAPTSVMATDGDYPAKGVVKKVNVEQGSIELDHEDIPGLMPPMVMEFFVTDKTMLDGLKVGDRVDFVLRYKRPTETIIKITKAK